MVLVGILICLSIYHLKQLGWIFKWFNDAAADAGIDATHKLVFLWVILGPLENHRHRSISEFSDSLVIPLVILENDLKMHVFLESAVAAALAPASRFKDPAQDTCHCQARGRYK